MERDTELYRSFPGSITSSLRLLPKWYQLISLCAVLSLLWFDNSAVISSIVKKLHFSFGTSAMWPELYLRQLEDMSLHERVSFALYSAVLGVIVYTLLKLRSLSRVSVKDESMKADMTNFIPHSSMLSRVVIASACLEAAFALREELQALFDDTTSASSLAIAASGSTNSSVLPTNKHIIVQLDIGRQLTVWWAVNVGVPAVCCLVYRLAQDAPKKLQAPLRWYLITFARCRALFVVVWKVLISGQDLNQSDICLLLWVLLVHAILNHTYALEMRRHMRETASKKSRMGLSINAVFRCSVLSLVAPCIVLTVMVGVHVFELILLWMYVLMVAVWLPASIDSFSTDFFTFCGISTAAFLSHFTDASSFTAVRAGGLMFAVLLSVSAAYNAFARLFRSRVLPIVMLIFFVVGYMYITSTTTADVLKLVTVILTLLRDAITSSSRLDTKKMEDIVEKNLGIDGILRQRNFHSPVVDIFSVYPYAAALIVLILSLVFSFSLNVYSTKFHARKRFPAQLPVVTPDLALRKFCHSVVMCSFLGMSIGLGYVVYTYVIPTATTVLPFEIEMGVSFVCSSMLLGVLMEAKSSAHAHLLSAVGVEPGMIRLSTVDVSVDDAVSADVE